MYCSNHSTSIHKQISFCVFFDVFIRDVLADFEGFPTLIETVVILTDIYESSKIGCDRLPQILNFKVMCGNIQFFQLLD
jgi:hypothetical protein